MVVRGVSQGLDQRRNGEACRIESRTGGLELIRAKPAQPHAMLEKERDRERACSLCMGVFVGCCSVIRLFNKIKGPLSRGPSDKQNKLFGIYIGTPKA